MENCMKPGVIYVLYEDRIHFGSLALCGDCSVLSLLARSCPTDPFLLRLRGLGFRLGNQIRDFGMA